MARGEGVRAWSRRTSSAIAALWFARVVALAQGPLMLKTGAGHLGSCQRKKVECFRPGEEGALEQKGATAAGEAHPVAAQGDAGHLRARCGGDRQAARTVRYFDTVTSADGPVKCWRSSRCSPRSAPSGRARPRDRAAAAI